MSMSNERVNRCALSATALLAIGCAVLFLATRERGLRSHDAQSGRVAVEQDDAKLSINDFELWSRPPSPQAVFDDIEKSQIHSPSRHKSFRNSSLSQAKSSVLVRQSKPSPSRRSDSFHFAAEETVYEPSAKFHPGDEIRIYAIGGSNIHAMPWLDQVHLALKRLGYKLPVMNVEKAGKGLHQDSFAYNGAKSPMCDDLDHYKDLKTARFVLPGGNSWNYAFEEWESCVQPHWWSNRNIEGVIIRCSTIWGCNSRDPVRASWLAEDAAKSNVTFLSTHQNDMLGEIQNHFNCFYHRPIPTDQMIKVSVYTLRKMIDLIHKSNPEVVIGVIAAYATAAQPYSWLPEYRASLKQAVLGWPNVFYVDYDIPPGDSTFFQQCPQQACGHLSCRGSRFMANAVMEALFQSRVISTGIKFADSTFRGERECSVLSVSECHTSAYCHVDIASKKCSVYQPGYDGEYMYPYRARALP